MVEWCKHTLILDETQLLSSNTLKLFQKVKSVTLVT